MLNDTFFLRKMRHEGAPELQYFLGEHRLNGWLGKTLSLRHTGKKECVECGRSIKKTFQQGYCFPCMQGLAKCDMCIVKPELCHYHKGTCREPEWGKQHCLIDHVVYLANTTGLKVGITKAHKVLERWGDQGAFAALPIARVPERLVSGKLEKALAEHISDKTDWRGLIKGVTKDVDLYTERARVVDLIPPEYQRFVLEEDEAELMEFSYPVVSYPERAITHNFDKLEILEGELTGVRGQYLFLSGKAVNIRKFAGYEIELRAS